MTPHRIRLAGFWVASPAPGDCTTHSRRFGAPGQRCDQVWLIVGVPCEVRLNGVLLGLGTEFRVDPHLKPRNTAEITLAAGVPLGEVSVEIRPG